MNKRGDTKTVLGIVIGLLILSIIGSIIYFYFTYDENPVTAAVNSVVSIFNDPDAPEFPEEDTQEYLANLNNNVGGGGGGGGGSSEGGGSTSSTSSGGAVEECTIPINFYLINFVDRTVCLAYDNEICVEKIVNCSIEMENRDLEGDGYFNMRLSFVEQGKDITEAFDMIDQNFIIAPRERDTFAGEKAISSTGEGGLANKEIKCYFNTLVSPYKLC